MPNEPTQSKWHAIKEKSEAENFNAPVNTAAKIKRLYLDTQIGSPVDTAEELDAQRNNLGPVDTAVEVEPYNEDSAHSFKP